MRKLDIKNSKGFTIIEVLIVLAIAALILLVVFLAVPALQRNSRNTNYKNEASQLMSATSEFVGNNNGNNPTGTNSAAILGLTNNKDITSLTITNSTANQTPNLTTAILVTGRKCGAATGTAYSTQAAGTRALALIYATESSSGAVVPNCIEG